MAPNIINLQGFSPTFNQCFFFDNNIWMFLFCPLGNYYHRKQREYSQLLETLLQRKSSIFINSLVISEFSNAYLRLDFNLWNKENAGDKVFKRDYVGTDRYKETVDEIKKALNRIYCVTDRVPDNFNAISLENLSRHLESIDFNDSYYIEQAALKNWIIVTDDADFISYLGHSTSVLTSM